MQKEKAKEVEVEVVKSVILHTPALYRLSSQSRPLPYNEDSVMRGVSQLVPSSSSASEAVAYQVDIDYEYRLYSPPGCEANLKAIREWEYVYFLLSTAETASTTLRNSRDYDPTYLDHLRGLGFTIPRFDPAAENYLPFWGHNPRYADRELERKLNSKLTSSLLAAEKGWGFHDGTYRID